MVGRVVGKSEFISASRREEQNKQPCSNAGDDHDPGNGECRHVNPLLRNSIEQSRLHVQGLMPTWLAAKAMAKQTSLLGSRKFDGYGELGVPSKGSEPQPVVTARFSRRWRMAAILFAIVLILRAVGLVFRVVDNDET